MEFINDKLRKGDQKMSESQSNSEMSVRVDKPVENKDSVVRQSSIHTTAMAKTGSSVVPPPPPSSSTSTTYQNSSWHQSLCGSGGIICVQGT